MLRGLAIPLISVTLFAQEAGGPALPSWNVLYGVKEFATANSMFSSYLSKLRAAEQERRSQRLARLGSTAAIEAYQRETRARLREALGEMPPRTPLNALVTGRLERDGYVVEKLIFESRPRFYVTANVYVPRKGSGPYPGVIAPVGHWGMGKAFDEYQQLGIYLARRGYVVLVYDVPGQGERREYFNPVTSRSLIDDGGSHWFVTLEHGYAGAQAILTGGNYASYLVWDGIRALDYLTSRKDVDPNRLACTGTSGGGLQTELLSAIDERIRISIPVCYGGCNPDNPARPGLDSVDIDALIAPRPLLMIEATGDPRPSVAAKLEKHREVAHLYRVAGEERKTRFIVVEGPHGYVAGMQRAAYSWLQRWFHGADASEESLAEPATPLEPAANLHATAAGEVSMSLGGETVGSLNRAHAARLAADRKPGPGLRETIRAAIALGRPQSDPGARVLSREQRSGYKIEKIVYHSEPGIFVPALLLLPDRPDKHPAAILVNEEGKAEPKLIEHYLEPLVKAGAAVLSIDPRGMGETDPDTPQSSKPTGFRRFVHDAESNYFHDAIRVGGTVPGMRALDLIAGVNYLAARPEIDATRISAIGHGAGGLIVLFATAFEPRIRAAAVTGALVSYSAIAESEFYTHRFGSFGPGFLRSFDLPDAASLVAPRPLLIQNAVDARHRVLTSGEAASAYRTAGPHVAVHHDTSPAGILARYQALVLSPASGR